MIDETLQVDDVAVRIHVDDRDAGEGCFGVEGDRYCVCPGYRFLAVATAVVFGHECDWHQVYDRPEDFEDVKAACRLAVRRAIDRFRPAEPEKGQGDGKDR